MKTEWISGAAAKLALTVAGAAAIGGGNAVLKAATTNAVQDQRLGVLETNQEKMQELSDKLDVTNRKVDVLNERLRIREDNRE